MVNLFFTFAMNRWFCSITRIEMHYWREWTWILAMFLPGWINAYREWILISMQCLCERLFGSRLYLLVISFAVVVVAAATAVVVCCCCCWLLWWNLFTKSDMKLAITSLKVKGQTNKERETHNLTLFCINVTVPGFQNREEELWSIGSSLTLKSRRYMTRSMLWEFWINRTPNWVPHGNNSSSVELPSFDGTTKSPWIENNRVFQILKGRVSVRGLLRSDSRCAQCWGICR